MLGIGVLGGGGMWSFFVLLPMVVVLYAWRRKTGRKRETEMREKAGPKVTRGTSGKGILGPVMQLGS